MVCEALFARQDEEQAEAQEDAKKREWLKGHKELAKEHG